MGNRGPKRTPTKVLEMSGSWRGKNRKDEPVPPNKKVYSPKWLTKDARKVWLELSGPMFETGVLTIIDRNAFARYCTILAQWKLAAKLGLDGIELTAKISAHLLTLEREFGLTPSARAGMATTESNPRENRGKTSRWARPKSG